MSEEGEAATATQAGDVGAPEPAGSMPGGSALPRDHRPTTSPWGNTTFFWWSLGFKTTPSTAVVQLYFLYAMSASGMLALNKHIARQPWFDALQLVQIQLGLSLICIGIGKVSCGCTACPT